MSNSQTELRKKDFDFIRAEMSLRGLHEHQVTISIVKANLGALVCSLPIIVVAWAIFGALWHGFSIDVTMIDIFIFLILFIISILVHELLHGIGWALSSKQGFSSIRFGVIWKYLTPYCHCKEPLSFGAYLFGGLLPCFVLGIAVCCISFVTGNTLVLVFGSLGILAAGGDLTIAVMLLKYRNALIVDHPTDCGFYAFTTE